MTQRPQTVVEASFQNRRARQPPLYPLNSRGFDRVQAIGGLLDLPPDLKKLCDEGRVVFGEVGDAKPDARTYPVSADGYVCELTSGVMDFFYAIARAASGVSVVYDQEGHAQNGKVESLDDLTRLIDITFKQWKKFCTPSLFDAFWKQNRIEHATFAVGDPARSIADHLATWAECFALSHELGHAALNSGLVTSTQPLEELRADSVGLDIFLNGTLVQKNLRIALAGMVFCIRVFEGLERSGVRFSNAYPPQEVRIEKLIAQLRAKCPSQQYHDEACTVLVSQLDLFDDVDRRLQSTQPEPPSNSWRRRVAIIAALQTLVSNKRPESEWLGMFALTMKGSSLEEQTQLAQTLLRYYGGAPTGASFVPEAVRTGMGEALTSCISKLQPEQAALFGAVGKG